MITSWIRANLACPQLFRLVLATSFIGVVFFTWHLGVFTSAPYSCVPLGFGNDSMPKIALASFPGSGNTWVRHLIQQLTGIYTGSIYGDPGLRHKGFLGEAKRTNVMTIKTHRSPTDTGLSLDRAIIIVRSPYDCLLAEFMRTRKGHTGVMTEINETAWDRFFNTTATEWYNFHLSWLTSGIPLYILNYRALKENLKPELVKLASHLGEPTLSEEHLQCVLDNAEGSAKRPPHERPSWLFPPDKRQVLDEMVLHVCTLIVEKTGIQILL